MLDIWKKNSVENLWKDNIIGVWRLRKTDSLYRYIWNNVLRKNAFANYQEKLQCTERPKPALMDSRGKEPNGERIKNEVGRSSKK